MNLKTLQEKGAYLTPVLFALFVFFIPLSPSLKSVFFVLAIASVLFNPYYNQNLFYAFNSSWGRLALLFVGFVALACLWSPASFSMQMSVLSKYSKLLYLPILAVGFISSKTRFWCMNAYLLSMVVTCITALLKIKGFVHVGNPIDPGELFYNHIITGFMMALACYVAALQGFKFKGWPRAFYLFVVLITSYQILFLNTGRTGYVIYLLVMGLLLIQKLPLKKAFVGMLVLSALMFIAYSLSPTMQSGIHNLIVDAQSLHANNANSSIGFRFQFHDYAQSLVRKHPFFGVGTGGFQFSFIKDQPIPAWGKLLNDPHSQYWLTLSEQGLIGAVLLGLFFASLFLAAFKLTEYKSLLLGILITFCVGSSFDSILCYSTIGYLLIVFTALSFGESIEKYALEKKKELNSVPNLEGNDLHLSSIQALIK